MMVCSPATSLTISQPGDVLRAGVVGSVNLLSVLLENVNLKPLLTTSKLYSHQGEAALYFHDE